MILDLIIIRVVKLYLKNWLEVYLEEEMSLDLFLLLLKGREEGCIYVVVRSLAALPMTVVGLCPRALLTFADLELLIMLLANLPPYFSAPLQAF